MFGYHIAGIIYHIGIVAGSAVHGVSACTAVKMIIAFAADKGIIAGLAIKPVVCRIADNDIIEVVAHAVNVCRTGQGQVLHVGRQGVGHRGIDQVGAGIGSFRDPISCVVGNVGVVACTTGHGVGSSGTIDKVGPTIADNSVIQIISGAVDVGRAGQGEVFHIVRQGVV